MDSETQNGANDMANYSNARSKFDRNLDIKDIAKALRADVKKLQKMGLFAGMKVSVRIERYSMGQSLNVTITKWDGQLHNPEWIAEDPNYRYEINRWAAPVSRAVKALEVLANQWNYDNSDAMTDYYDVNYYTSVSVCYELARADRKAQETAAELAA
jgi:hypothetical protein